MFLYQKRLEQVNFILTDDASKYFRLLEVKTVGGFGQQMFADLNVVQICVHSIGL